MKRWTLAEFAADVKNTGSERVADLEIQIFFLRASLNPGLCGL